MNPFLAATCLLFSSMFAFFPVVEAHAQTLEEYVADIDSSFSWNIVHTFRNPDYTAYIVRLTSLRWRSPEEVSQPLWQHWLTVVRPTKIESNQGLLYVGNGTSKESSPSMPDSRYVDIALHTHTVVAELRNVPNQPLVYLNDGKERYEDDSVAYSWKKVLETHDPSWSIRLPMVKSISRAMDAVQALLKSGEGGNINVDRFVLAGASKRGWAIWLSAAVDSRVSAIIPMVIDILNVKKFLSHHYSTYGFWAPAVKDYVNHHILDAKNIDEIVKIEDPYTYRDQIKVPKYLIHASGDQFFIPDHSPHYFSDLVGPKYLRVLPNSDHSLQGSDAWENMEAFYFSVIKKASLPRFSWIKEKDGSLKVTTLDPPLAVKLWSAHNPKARDFRVEAIGKVFSSTPLIAEKDGSYIAAARTQVTQSGYTAFFIEMTYKSEHSKFPLKLTTEVSVLPETFPPQAVSLKSK
jgi:PhoPQ-activated pathogenicity-related protein